MAIRQFHSDLLFDVFNVFFSTFFLKQCHWSDMFTGRLRSEIPPALVRKSPSQKVQLYVFAVSKKLVSPPLIFSRNHWAML